MPEYPPVDPSAARAEAAAALMSTLREVRDVLERLQLAAAWVLDAYGDTADAETIRMLPIGPGRPGRPPVPPAADFRHLATALDGDISPRAAEAIADLVDLDRELRAGPDSVTSDESGPAL